MNDPEQLFKCLNVQFSCTAGEDESMDVEIMSGVLKNATHRLFERKDQCLVLKSGRNRYTCIK